MNERSCFYLGGDALHSGIYSDLLQRVEDEGVRVGLVARWRVSPNPLATWQAWQRRHVLGTNSLADLRARLPGGVEVLPMWNLLPALSAPSLLRLLHARAPRGTVVLHARQIVMARLALAVRRLRPGVRVIAELEGDDLAELDYKQGLAPRTVGNRLRGAIERRYYDHQDRRILRASDAVICVSQILKDVLVRRYALGPIEADRIHVITTLATKRDFFFDPARRESTRESAGLRDRFVVIYTGNLRGAWQRPDKLVEAFARIRAGRANAFFLVLTPDSDRRYIEPLLARAGIPQAAFRIHSSPHGEIVNYLCASDVGLLLRDRHPMNEAAAPGKFGEYTLSGLPIVMTDGIGDFSGQMRGHDLACVLPDLDDPETMARRLAEFCSRDFTNAERLALSRWAGERFATEASVPKLAALYRAV